MNPNGLSIKDLPSGFQQCDLRTIGHRQDTYWLAQNKLLDQKGIHSRENSIEIVDDIDTFTASSINGLDHQLLVGPLIN